MQPTSHRRPASGPIAAIAGSMLGLALAVGAAPARVLAQPAPAVRIEPTAPGGGGDPTDPGDLLARPIVVQGRNADIVITAGMSDVRFLAGGWGGPETWQEDPPVVRRWSLGPSSAIRFELGRVEPLLLSLRALPYQPPGGRPQEVRVWLNGEYVGSIAMQRADRRYEIALPAPALREGMNQVRFRYLWTEQPHRVDPRSGDNRPLAIAFSEIAIRPPRKAEGEEPQLVTAHTAARSAPFRGLLPPRSGRVSMLLWPPQGSALELGWILLPGADDGGAPAIRVEVEWDGDGRVLLDTQPKRVEQVETARLPLPAEAEGAVRVHLSVEGGGDRRLVWLEPRVVPPAPAAAAAPPLRAAPGTNLVVIVLDAATRDRLGIYGRTTGTTPLLARLAGESLVFDAAYASASHTLPSTASLFTSRLPPEHGSLDERAVLGAHWPTLAEALAARGYATAAFSANPFVSPVMGTTRGFARVDELFRGKGPGEVARGEEFLPPVRSFFEAHRERPFFAYIHLLQPHEPYNAGPKAFYAGRLDPAHQGRFDGSQARIWEVYQRRLFPSDAEIAHIRGLYEGNLAYADSISGEICRALGELGLWGRTIVVVTADHGEALGEHGSWGHGEGVTRPQIAIPLLVRLPPGLVAPGRRSELVATVDLMPSVLGVLGIEAPPGLRGRSWFARDPAEWPRSVLSVGLGRTGTVSVVAPGIKYSHDPDSGTEQLLPVPAEEDGPNLRWERPVTFAYLAEEASRLLALDGKQSAPVSEPPALALPAEVKEALKALGYVE